MREISDELLSSLDHKALLARITLDGWQVVQNDPDGDEPIQNIHFDDGTGANSDAVSIGSTVAACATVYLDQSLVDYALIGREMHIELGMELDSGSEWFDMGTYIITDAQDDEGTITVTGMDKMVSELDAEYESIDGYDFEIEEGVSAQGFVTAACQRLGITVDFEDLQDHQLTQFSPEGCTWRQLIGFVAAMYGRFAKICRDGVLRFRWYQNVDIKITPDDYYEDGLMKSSYSFTVSWLKCYNEVLEETLTEGDSSADQGIYFSCPWMTPDILADIWAELSGYTYAPVSELTFFGDPRLESGDAPRLVCLDGEIYRVPIMGITHDWDGGLITSITAAGQVKSNAYEGPVTRETKRSIAKILKRADSIELSVENVENEISYLNLEAGGITQRVKDAEGNISELQVQAEALEAKAEDAAGNIAALQVQSDELNSQVQNLDGDVTQIKQNAGQVSVTATDDGGTLRTEITPTAWYAERTNAAGEVTSSFKFDFASGQFVYNGTGKFMSPDGNSYITVDGNSFVLFSKGSDGAFSDIARIGYSEDSDAADFPYILLKNLGMVKAFGNGIFVGNTAPMLSTGNFVGLAGAVGFFVDVVDQKTYNVVGTELYDAFTAVFG